MINKREYNSDRRRKLSGDLKAIKMKKKKIRENITPIGDGNFE